ncbi:MAG: VCBS repeat-containing protein [Acidobacteria bacterium]|nr:VCBS repeat-containing protein [Acidobacteriota bacterium]
MASLRSGLAEKRTTLSVRAGVFAAVVLITLGIFAANNWFPRTDAFTGKRYGWFGSETAAAVPPLPTPQLSREYLYAGSRLLAVEDANAAAAPPADLAVWRPSTGVWYVRINGYQWISQTWGQQDDRPVPGDYDGDGTTDFSIWRPSNFTWYVIHSSTGAFYSYQFGGASDLMAAADYDGDGMTDEAVFRPTDGTWYISASMAGYYLDTSIFDIGDLPAPADYDGDGKADLGVFRPSERKFYSKNSSNGATVEIAPNFNPNGPSWQPVSADYDGDGKADYAVYNANSGTWYIRSSITGTFPASPVQWGQSGDIPVPNDYDADAKVDYATWRPATGTWYIVQSATNYSQRQTQWGQSGDIPVPAFFRR